ncbi:50S ribosomal protein L29 [Mycoplasma bradburyae]|uniref:Large ribosomal subunit protein uL29 n=1 Tax=Mycoplasma bradburyae TaxID=2963128 RepID=A0AAW6HPN0_9MOLU|nr:50S ribosomal protein L29 [Mycoplasma bradburyae]MDC4163273.1 50S ribosomal protein L29 [Mycoplasma bradburyae]MDC4181887.1 50S ribosomal protein L29 [Mycoplasma bradburyae]MDC4182586.1 50S ribosomal protein L29 [Mycoplasma bradburyae]MDC4183264.1 50S ribosomal protein L29 [Mycoplasma bradburyae]MDC4184070.1 50S ribosomal protein L29 [Mycoplasma bradburyae]
MNKELRAKTTEELTQLVTQLKGRLLEYRFKLAQGELDKTHIIKETRLTLARVLTILTERNVKINVNQMVSSFAKEQAKQKEIQEAVKKVKELKAARDKKNKEKRLANAEKVKAAPKPEPKAKKVKTTPKKSETVKSSNKKIVKAKTSKKG